MLKYVNHDIVFQEYPDEMTLAINLSLCPNQCPGCHSEYLWGDVGEELTADRLLSLLEGYGKNITCVGFMGGDNDPHSLVKLAAQVRLNMPYLKIGWYSGRPELPTEGFPQDFPVQLFDYIKLGSWQAACGPLKERTTNQRMYKIVDGRMVNITERFWKK